MKYQAGSRRKAVKYEKALTKWWKVNKIFERSVEERPLDKSYVFYDGPPFITGTPHHGTLLSSIVKDAVPRFWTMNGYRVERRWGWDCHGLPAENFVEKQLGITDRREIGTKWSLEEYIIKAKESMKANSETWRATIDRVGRWVDFDHAYRTMDKDYMESVWWAFSELYKAGKIFEGRKVLMYDTKFATPVSKAEVTMDNDAYQEVTDPSAYVKFRLKSSEDPIPTYLLAWTTTPWTLTANMCLAVNPEMEYGVYEVEEERLVLAVERAKQLLPEMKPVVVMKGSGLVGKKYEPIFAVADGLFDLGVEGEDGTVRRKDTYTVLPADFVSAEDGTGIVHIAPAYGEDDYALFLEHEVDFVDVLDENGYYLPEMAEKMHEIGVRDTDEHGIQIWAGNKFIAKCLEEKGVVWKIEYIKHEYPFNPRSKERIIYRAFPSWFFDVTNQKKMMLEENEHINWFPEYLKEGRFAKNIEAAPDWNLSRDRFFATAMPVWKGDKGSIKVVGSYEELFELSGVRLEDYHRPWVDEIEFDINGEHFKRIPKVLDCWFESGAMPFAELHYPFENREKFEKNYPADFIVEYVGQVRAWFYYVHALNTALAEIGAFGEKVKRGAKNAYKNVITTGTLAGNDGRKMSKSLGNYTDPNELMDQYSADALRFLLLSSPVLAGEDFALLDKDVSDVQRRLAMIWNVYDFFCMYAEVERLDTEDFNTAEKIASKSPQKDLSNPLDIWIVSRMYQLRDEITEGMEKYDIPTAIAGVLPFIDDLSNWFVRRSRRRFSRSEDEVDKREAFSTLYDVLVYLAQILAPFVPFLAEELYQKMTGKEESVHLLAWPEAGVIHTDLIEEMARTREIITEGLAQRMQKSETEEQIKIRQPLAELTYDGEKLPEFYERLIADEVNVKKVIHGAVMKLNKTLTPELKQEGFLRELIRAVQTARKKAGLAVDDRIVLSVSCKVPEEYLQDLRTEVLAEEVKRGATSMKEGNEFSYNEMAKVNGKEVKISFEVVK